MTLPWLLFSVSDFAFVINNTITLFFSRQYFFLKETVRQGEVGLPWLAFRSMNSVFWSVRASFCFVSLSF